MNPSPATLARDADTATPIRVLIAEDEAHLGAILEQFMSARGFAVRIVRDGRSALDLLRSETFDVALLDVVMPEIDGLEVLRLVREEPLPPEIIVITGNGTIETAIAALKLGAYDFLSKPYRMAEIEVLVRRAWEKRMLARDNHLMQSRLKRSTPTPELITQYAPLRAVLAMVEKVAPSASPVLVTGESDGKDLVARLLHAHGRNPDGPFVDLQLCGAAESLLETELFGVEKGAFPGADQRKVGLFELAAGGTLYLDNIGELDLRLQAARCARSKRGVFSVWVARRRWRSMCASSPPPRAISPAWCRARRSVTICCIASTPSASRCRRSGIVWWTSRCWRGISSNSSCRRPHRRRRV